MMISAPSTARSKHTENCFVPPEKIEFRQAITNVAKAFSERKTTIAKPRTPGATTAMTEHGS